MPRTLLLLHGYTGSRRDFEHLLPAFSSRLGLDAVAYDHRGHGRAKAEGNSGTIDLETLAAGAVRVLDEHGIERAHLLGHSMGGMVALRFALAFPARCESLILAGTGANAVELGPLGRLSWKQRLLLPLRRALHTDPSARMADALYGGEETRARFLAVVRASERDVHPHAKAELHRAITGAASIAPRLRELRVKTTVIVGAHDNMFYEDAQQLAAEIPNAKLYVFPHSSHYPHFEQEELFLDAIEEHFQRPIVAAKTS
jgi:pimeloyl-ACP methyl ester carboxylesterase